MLARIVPGEALLIAGVTREEMKAFEEWIEQHSWRDCVGWVKFPARTPDKVTLYFDSSLGGTWYREIRPEVEEYWGSDRVLHTVEWEEE